MKKFIDTYLGDGLYATFDGWSIELYASNGKYKTDCVYLEPEVLNAFEKYIIDLKKALIENAVNS
jgi:hypothetical protein